MHREDVVSAREVRYQRYVGPFFMKRVVHDGQDKCGSENTVFNTLRLGEDTINTRIYVLQLISDNRI